MLPCVYYNKRFKYILTLGGKFDTYNFLMGIPSSVWVGTLLKANGDTSRFELNASKTER